VADVTDAADVADVTDVADVVGGRGWILPLTGYHYHRMENAQQRDEERDPGDRGKPEDPKNLAKASVTYENPS